MSEVNITRAAAQSSGIELTPAGSTYCEAQEALNRRLLLVRIIRGALDLADECIAELDAMDGDCDLEPFLAGFNGVDDDREADYEHGQAYGGSNGCADYKPFITNRGV